MIPDSRHNLRQGADAPALPGPAARRLRDAPFDAVVRIAGEIGPRRATSVAEAKAAAYVDGRLRRAGMLVSADPFRTTAAGGEDGLLLAVPALAAVVLSFWLPIPSLLLALWNAALAAFLLWRGAPLLGRRSASQNVSATRAAADSMRLRVVLLAPLDSPPVLSAVTRAVMRAGPARLRLAICVALVVLAALGLAPLPLEVRRWLWYAQMPAAALLALITAAELLALRRAFSAGGTNHAGALAAMLGAVENLDALEYVELWAVALGATGSGAGMADLLRRYPFDRSTTLLVSLEGIGAGSLCYVSAGDAPRGLEADALLLEHAYAAAAEPHVEAGPRSFRGGRTLAGTLRGLGMRTLAITCLDASGQAPLWASADDVPGQVAPELLDRAAHLAAAIVRRLDAAAQSG